MTIAVDLGGKATKTKKKCKFCCFQVHDVLHFFPTSSQNEIAFLWSSEKSGFRHLYHVTSQLSQQPSIDSDTDIFLEHEGKKYFTLCSPLVIYTQRQ